MLNEQQKIQAEKIYQQMIDYAVIKNIKNGKHPVNFIFTDGKPETLADVEEINRDAEMKIKGAARW